MARVLEELGIPTVTISMFTEVVDTVIPPRTILTQFPFGAPFGFPRNKKMQLFILREAVGLLENAKDPGTVFEVPYSWVQQI
jgi:hypothetical protein